MNIFGELTRAQLELRTDDVTPALPGRVYWRTDSSLFKVDTGAAIKTLVDANTAQTLTNKTVTQPVLQLQQYASAPTAGTAGRVIFNTNTLLIEIDDGSSWKSLETDVNTLSNVLNHGNDATGLSMIVGDITLSASTASTVPYLNSSKKLVSSAVTPTELGYLAAANDFAGDKTFLGNLTFKAGGPDAVVHINDWALNILAGDYINFWDNASTHRVGMYAPATVSSNYDLQLPTAQGAANSFLRNDGSGALSFVVAASANTASTLVQRDASGNFTAGTITASLTGNASGTALNVTGIVTNTHGGTGIDTSASNGVAHVLSGTWSVGSVVNADIDAAAAIVDTKLATISTSGKVSNSATTATNANTASAIVARDGSGNFSAGTISAALTGTATKATNIVGGLGGSIPYQTAVDTTALLANGLTGQFLKSNGTTAAPSWATPSVLGTPIRTMISKTTTYQILSTDDLILCDATSASFTITLPAGSGLTGQTYEIATTHTGAHTVTVKGSGSEGIGPSGANTIILNAGDTKKFIWDGSKWQSISAFENLPKIYVHYTGSTSPTIVTGTTNFNFSTLVVDSHGAWDGAIFTAPRTGFYIISGVYTGPSTSHTMAFYVNGSVKCGAGGYANSGGGDTHNFGGGVFLNATDTLSLRQASGTGGSSATNSTMHTISIYSQ